MLVCSGDVRGGRSERTDQVGCERRAARSEGVVFRGDGCVRCARVKLAGTVVD